MITPVIAEAGITRRSTNIERPNGPLWTSICRSLEGNTITDSANPRSLSFIDLASCGKAMDYPKVPALPSYTRTGSGIQESRASVPSDESGDNFSRKGPRACQKHTNHLPDDRSRDGKDQHKDIIKASVIRRGCILRSEVALGLNPEFAGTLGVFHDAVFRKHLRQRLAHSIQGDGVAKVRTCRNSHV